MLSLISTLPNFLGEVVRCGASRKKPSRDSTLKYSPGWFTFRDVPQIAAYHKKLQALELNSEVTHQLCLPNDLHTACDLVATVVNVLQRSCENIHVVVSVRTTSDAQTKEVKTTKAVLASYRVTVCKDVTDLATTYTSLEVKLDSKSLCWELLLRDVRQYLVSVYEQCVTL